MVTHRTYFVAVFLFIGSLIWAQAPTATIVAPSNTICSGVAYTFSSTVTGTISAYSWSVVPSAGVTFIPDNISSNVGLSFTNNGTYNVRLFVANSTGTFSTNRNIVIAKSAKASYNATIKDIGFPANLELTNFSSNALAYNWNFSGAIPTQTLVNVVQPYTIPGNYNVDLVAFGNNGCNDTLSYSFVIDDFSTVTLPNIFTPNNDGVNDVFKPILKGVSQINVWIYNRYGNIIYSWSGIKGFWDGYTTSGIQCTDGVYFCVVEAKGFDGAEYKRRTEITLVR